MKFVEVVLAVVGLIARMRDNNLHAAERPDDERGQPRLQWIEVRSVNGVRWHLLPIGTERESALRQDKTVPCEVWR
jgi:hypothetical protein